MAKEQSGVSLKPSDQVEGGGLLDNVDATFEEVVFDMFDYGGTQSEVPALRASLKADDAKDAVEQYWSCGAAKDWEPSKDGKRLVPIGDQKGLNKTSNVSIFFDYLIRAGFPEDKIADDVSVLEGLKAHMVRIPAPVRGGLPSSKKREDGREFAKTVLVVESILHLPWEKGGGKVAKGKDASEGDEASTKASEAIMAILSDNPKGVEKMKLIGMVFTNLKKDGCKMELVNAATRLIRDESVEGPWKVEKGVYIMG